MAPKPGAGIRSHRVQGDIKPYPCGLLTAGLPGAPPWDPGKGDSCVQDSCEEQTEPCALSILSCITRLREAKGLAQGHTAGRRQSGNLSRMFGPQQRAAMSPLSLGQEAGRGSPSPCWAAASPPGSWSSAGTPCLLSSFRALLPGACHKLCTPVSTSLDRESQAPSPPGLREAPRVSRWPPAPG